jgi:DNA sulfur modification protein DndB
MEYYGDAWLVKGLPRNIYTKAKKLADDKTYELLSNNGDAEDVEIWDYVSLSDCQAIVLNGKNWSTFFEDFMVRPEETKIAGGKEAKTQWIIRLSSIKNKLSKESYSVPVDEYSYIKSIHDWIMDMLTL